MSITNYEEYTFVCFQTSIFNFPTFNPDSKVLLLTSQSNARRWHCVSTMEYRTCGHRVQTNAGEQCGTNCSHPSTPAGKPFACRLCLAQPILEGFGLAPESSMDESWDPTPYWAELATPIVGALVEDELRPLLGSGGHRDAMPLPKTDGLAEFVRDYGTKVLSIGEREVQVLDYTKSTFN